VALFGRAVVLGAAGGFGRLLSRLLAEDRATVTGVDVAPRPASFLGSWLMVDATAPDPQLESAVGAAELLVVALPEAAAFGALETLSGALPGGALIVDTMSVKTPVAAWAAADRSGPGVLSINPLFAPDLGFAGRVVAAVSVRPGGDQDGLLTLLERAGCEVLVMSADAHDRETAATQVLTHAAALAVTRALGRHADGPMPRTVTPPHRALMLLAARILAGSPSVYWAIQRTNPYAAEARRLLIEAAAEIDALVSAGDEAEFVRLFDELRADLGDSLGGLARQGATMLAAVPVTSTDRSHRA
jgi:prephenate dehydrogenase